MILTPEEQIEYREEIDYAIETHGYEYVWGKETGMDKLRGFSRDAPGKVISGLTKIVTNPTVIAINEKLAAHNAKLNAEDKGKSGGRGNQMLGGIGGGSGFGGLPQNNRRMGGGKSWDNVYQHQEQRKPPKKKLHRQSREPEQEPQYQDDIFGDSPLGEHPLQRGKQPKNQNSNGLHFGGDHL
jgi:hypothetical protein